MYPILFSISSFHLSSFGVFLSLAILASIFTVWRIARSYDLNQDKIFDLSILTLLIGFITSRIVFVLLNLKDFGNLSEIVLFYKHPGLSLWGGLVGGTIALYLFSRKFKLNFWQIADFTSVGILIGLIIGDIGCFLSGCGYGIISNSIISTPVVGTVGKRLPIQLLEALLFLFLFRSLFRQVLRFHFTGKILSLFLIYFGIIKFITEFYKDGVGYVGSVVALPVIGLGSFVYYKKGKKSFILDLEFVVKAVISSRQRGVILLKIRRSYYNQKINLRIKLGNLVELVRVTPRNLRRRINVKPTPKNLV